MSHICAKVDKNWVALSIPFFPSVVVLEATGWAGQLSVGSCWEQPQEEGCPETLPNMRGTTWFNCATDIAAMA